MRKRLTRAFTEQIYEEYGVASYDTLAEVEERLGEEIGPNLPDDPALRQKYAKYLTEPPPPSAG